MSEDLDAGSIRSQEGPSPTGVPGWLQVATLALIALSCSQLGYVGHPRYGPFIAAADVLCALLFVVWAIRVWACRRMGELTWPPAALWAWVAAAVLSVSMAAVEGEGALARGAIKDGVVEVAQLVLYFVVAYMIFVDILRDGTMLRRAYLTLLAASCVVVLWGLADYVTQADAMQVKAGFGNRNAYSAFLVMVIPLLVGVSAYGASRLLRGGALALAFGAAITMLGPPHVWLMAGLTIAVAYYRGGAYRARVAPAAAALTLLVCLALPRNYEANVSSFLDPYERGEMYKLAAGSEADEASTGDQTGQELIVKKRWLEWQPALVMMTENLPLGVGAGRFQDRLGEAEFYGSLPNVKKSEPDTNNLYLVVGGSMGLAGLVALIGLLAWFWRRGSELWRSAQSPTQRGLALGLGAAVVGIAAANIFTSLFVRGISVIWALVFAMITVATRLAASGDDEAHEPGVD